MPDDLLRLEADLRKALKRLEAHTTFAEALAEQRSGQFVLMDRRQVAVRPDPGMLGVALRAWAGDRWSEVATTRVGPTDLSNLVDALERTLSKRSVHSPPPGESSTEVGEWTQRPARPMSDLSIEEHLARTRTIFEWTTQLPEIREARALSGWIEDERFYVNTVGARCHEIASSTGAGLQPLAMENGKVAYDSLDTRGTGGLERVDLVTEEAALRTARMAIAQLSAKAPPSGEMTVLLDPAVSGTFVHESFGHGTEADQFVRERSYLAAVRGSKVGPDELTIVDDGRYSGGPGTIQFDDEGHRAQKTTLIDRGQFVGVLHDRETAAALGDRPTGNARRADVLSRLYVRMTNTYLTPGSQTFEELVEEARDGVVLERWTSGVEDPLGGRMQIKVLRGHRIEHGKLTDLVGSMALSGNVLEFLRQIRGIGRADDFLVDAGMCGKGHSDALRVGSGGSYVLSRAIVGPA